MTDDASSEAADEPAVFEIQDTPSAKGQVPGYEQQGSGYWAVWVHQDLIEREAKRQGVDPNLVKAIVYFENARGASYGHLFEFFGVSDSILPMNIKRSVWGDLVGEREDFSDPATNVRAGVTLIRRIQERIADPSVAKIASIYNFTGRENVSDNGARAAEFYADRAWERLPGNATQQVRDYNQRQRDFLRRRYSND